MIKENKERYWKVITAFTVFLILFIGLMGVFPIVQHGKVRVVCVLVAGFTAWYVLYKLVLQPYERKLTMHKQGEARFWELFDNAPDAMALVDKAGRIILVNREVEGLFGYLRREMLDKNIGLLEPKNYLTQHLLAIKKYPADSLTPSRGMRFESCGLRKEGQEFPIDVSLLPIEYDHKQLVLIDIRDATERKNTESKIRRGYLFQRAISNILKISIKPLSLEEQLELILNEILEIPWFALQKKGCIFLVEDDPEILIMKVQMGMEETVVTQCSQVHFGSCYCGEVAASNQADYPECLSNQYAIQIRSGEKIHGVLNLFFKENHTRDKLEEKLLYTIADTLASIIEHRSTDLERERLQEELIHTEKLAALGRMTVNVAHEIRNPLTALGGLARRLNKTIPETAVEKGYVKIIHAEAMRLEKILNSILSLTTHKSFNPEPCDINEIICDIVKLFEDLAWERLIKVESSFTELPQILIDRDKLHELFNNLINNAMEAMVGGGGAVLFTTSKEMYSDAMFVVVEVRDSGKGIAEEELDRIFEPFYTSKTIGAGLGLAICKKIMDQHSGFLTFESEVGTGTSVKLFFPC